MRPSWVRRTQDSGSCVPLTQAPYLPRECARADGLEVSSAAGRTRQAVAQVLRRALRTDIKSPSLRLAH